MTMQRLDTLLYKERRTIIYSQPLEKYFDANTRPAFFSFDTSMTARGYYAGWEIKNGKLFLIDFVGHQLIHNWNNLEFWLNDLFKDIPPPIFAEWFTDDIEIPTGEDISTSIYPRYNTFLILSMHKGQLIKEGEVSAS